MSILPSIPQPGLIPLRWPVANAGPHPIGTGIRALSSPEQDASDLVAAHVQAVSDMLAEIHLTIWNDRERGAL